MLVIDVNVLVTCVGKKSHSEEWLFLERPKITSFLQQQVQQVQQVQRLEIQQQEQQVQQLELQQQVLVQVQEQRLLLFCRKQPEPKPAGKRSATIFS